jgi:glutamine amidotransferase
MNKRVVIVDYGIGNIFSVKRAVEVSGAANVIVSERADDILYADKIILPGVGAFEDGMKGLRERGLIHPLKSAAQDGKSILGICLGMQLMATTSEEFGIHEGLSLIPGKVQAIPKFSVDGRRLKVPFIGWSTLNVHGSQFAEFSCLGDPRKMAVYLVHSFHFLPSNPNCLLADYEYGGHKINAAVRRDNLLGVQFHPEKSGSVGLGVLKKFFRS